MWKIVIFILCAGLVPLNATPEPGGIPIQDGPSYRLSNTTEPLKYELWIETHIHEGDFAFSGRVIITLRTLVTTGEIQLNSVGLDIHDGYYREEFSETRKVMSISALQESNQIITIPTEDALIAGRNYVLTLEYTGTLQGQSRGFYYSRYTDDFGRSFYIASTAFQHIFARWAFPCYDEPRFRTPFTIHVTHGSLYQAVSNMAVLSMETQ